MTHDLHDTRWHLDKKVPISIIAAILFQFAGGLWFISKLDARIAALEALGVIQLSSQRDRDQTQDKQVADAIQLVRTQLERMDDKLDRIIERPRKQ
jgi:hypothetical protein